MQTFTPFQYIKLDIANSFGLDDKLFQERLDWFEANKDNLAGLVNASEEPAQFYAGILAYQDVMSGTPTGYLVGMDATASGLQCIAALCGCPVTASSVNMVDPDKRKDVYTDGYHIMLEKLDGKMDKFERKPVKGATMTNFYGSMANPRKLFGENSKELATFYEMLEVIAPGGQALKNDLISIWQPGVLQHSWTLPDGFEAVVKVITTHEDSFEVNELKSSFTHRYHVNEGQDAGLSLAANTIHSVDGFVVREMNRRANYDRNKVRDVVEWIDTALSGEAHSSDFEVEPQYARLIKIWKQCRLTSIRIIDYITPFNVAQMPNQMMVELQDILKGMLQYKPFPLICIHDCFKCHPNYMNHVRQNYINIFMQLADSKMLESMVQDITGKHTPVRKLTRNLSSLIEQSNYMLS